MIGLFGPVPTRIDGKTIKPGTEVEVIIEGKAYTTVISPGGVQRFPENSVLHYMFNHDSQGKPIDHGDPKQMHTQMLNVNTLAMAYRQGKFDKREWMEITMSGYSVSGFCDISDFADWHIFNPLWEDCFVDGVPVAIRIQTEEEDEA